LEINNKKYKGVYITLNIDAETNKLLCEASQRSKRTKLQEAAVRIIHHLKMFHSISDVDHALLKEHVNID